MRDKRKNNIGLLTFVLYLVLMRFTETPAFLLGVVLGISMALIILGNLSERRMIQIKNMKKGFLQK